MDDVTEPDPFAWVGPHDGVVAAVQVHYAEGELARSIAWMTGVRWRSHLLNGGAVFVAVMLLELTQDEPEWLLAVVYSSVALFVLVPFYFLAGYLHGRKLAATTTFFQCPINYVFTPTHMYQHGKGIQERIELSALFGVLETRTTLLIRQNAISSYIIPKRFFTERETLQKVRDCLRQGLPGTARIQLRND